MNTFLLDSKVYCSSSMGPIMFYKNAGFVNYIVTTHVREIWKLGNIYWRTVWNMQIIWTCTNINFH